MAKKENTAPVNNNDTEYSLNDDRRVRVLSPGMLVAKRFIRNRLAVTGMIILIAMFIFSFIGGLISPYKQDQKFYRTDVQIKDYAGVIFNQEFRYTVADKEVYDGLAQANTVLALQRNETSFESDGTNFTIEKIDDNTYTISADGKVVAITSKDVVSSSISNDYFDFDFTYAALMATANGEKSFECEGKTYTVDKDNSIFDESGEEYAYVSQYIVRAVMGDVFLSRDFKNKLIDAVEAKEKSFVYTDEEGNEAEYILSFDASKNQWDIKQETDTTIFDTYSRPSKKHWLGTDRNGMDMLTRLMYGGRVSLIIGFIVVFIESFIGVIFGGISGYFGGKVDNLMMRIVDIFYCIPSMPIIIIIGAAMDAANLDASKRMLMLMIVLGLTGWPGIARLVRGQILSLREQEFMTATEACGISIPRRIFKHLVPNVMPQLIVSMTMGLGSTIIIEATLSFLGLGVRFPFASWGNIINDVNNVFVLTHYWNIWIPAGVLLLLTVLAFNIVGDGLRDAFDPKMKR
ncbi:MAG: ABC transporter permease [Clostridiales bacterium]|nr:ABC transporter permease [Clostridiales bacterium]